MSKINKKVKLHQKTNWKSLSNEDLEKEYNPSSLIGGNYQPYIEPVSYTHLTLPTKA